VKSSNSNATHSVTRLFSGWFSSGSHGLRLLFLAALALTAVVVSGAAHAEDDERWNGLQSSFFGDRTINTDTNLISMKAPKRAHDAAVVPIVINALDDATVIKNVHLIVDKNPLPLAGIFRFSDNRSNWQSIETRIRINEYTNVRAVAELDDGSLHMTKRFVKAAGGCSAPAMGDLEASIARAGKMKIELDNIIGKSDALPNSPIANTEATIKISHPNNSGMQFDQISRHYIPAFLVHSIVAELNGEELVNIETNFSMSENPVVRFQFAKPDAAKTLSVYAVDSKNNRFERTIDATAQN